MLVIALGSLGLDVLLDGVDGRLVLDQFFLNVIQSIVYFTLQNLVLLCVVLHRMESDLFGEPVLVCLQELADFTHSILLVFELLLKGVSVLELVVNVVIHSIDFGLSLFHLLLDPSLEVFNFF